MTSVELIVLIGISLALSVFGLEIYMQILQIYFVVHSLYRGGTKLPVCCVTTGRGLNIDKLT